MSMFSRIYRRLYYLFWDLFLPAKQINIKNEFKNLKNIFLYFDYEREFGGHATTITNSDIDYILNLLKSNNIKSTWFTVGRIAEIYPVTIQNVSNDGHEIASHTFSHLSPYNSTSESLKRDFELFNKHMQQSFDIIGFHSPQGSWSYNMFKFLNIYSFKYHMVYYQKKTEYLVSEIFFGPSKSILRIQAAGDDWVLFKKNYDRHMCLEYLINLTEKVKFGQLAGIGFHPWILFSSKEILTGFELFIKYLSENKDVNISTARNLIDSILIRNKI